MWLLQAFDAKAKCYVLLGPIQLAWQAGSSEGAGPGTCAAMCFQRTNRIQRNAFGLNPSNATPNFRTGHKAQNAD